MTGRLRPQSGESSLHYWKHWSHVLQPMVHGWRAPTGWIASCVLGTGISFFAMSTRRIVSTIVYMCASPPPQRTRPCKAGPARARQYSWSPSPQSFPIENHGRVFKLRPWSMTWTLSSLITRLPSKWLHRVDRYRGGPPRGLPFSIAPQTNTRAPHLLLHLLPIRDRHLFDFQPVVLFASPASLPPFLPATDCVDWCAAECGAVHRARRGE